MIYEATLSNQSGELEVKARPSTFRTIFEFGCGLFCVGFGCAAIFGLLFLMPAQTGSIGKQIIAWTVKVVFVTAMGIVPLKWGLKFWFARRTYRICDKEAALLSLRHFAGMQLSTKRYLFSAFDRVAITPRQFGHFVSHTEFVVTCDGTQQLDLAVFDQHANAVPFATSLAAQMRLPVQDAG